jgi:uncharacterized protein YydD (DUF2326 family)
MKIKLLKLYSSPEIFKTIEFQDGINLIMGEKVGDANVKKGKKTNGVGKSLSVEFINFCLLKSTANSRVSKIPLDKFYDDTQIILDLEINSQPITIIRTKDKPENPTIIKDGKSTVFSGLDDANNYLGTLLFSEIKQDPSISFREFIGPFMREEGSEFKDIMMCYENLPGKTIPPAIKPNAFLFGIDVSVISDIQNKFKQIEKLSNHKTELKKKVTENGAKKVSDVKATLNSLNDDLKKIDKALESFKSNEAYSVQQDDLTRIQIEIDDSRKRQSALKYQLRRIKTLPIPENIKDKDMEIVYNQFKSGLGDMVTKSLKEVLVFKKKIDEFQNRLFNEKIKSLNEELSSVSEKLNNLEEDKLKIIKLIDQKGVLKDIKTGFAVYHQKKELYSSISNNYANYEKVEKELKDIKIEKDLCFQKLDSMIFEAKKIIDNFNETILDIHEYIMESNEASFDIKTITSGKSKQVLKFDMRIDDDGSHSIDRTKVFIYDLALLFNEYTQKRHPHLLIHDNIFDVDQDSLVKSLNYLAKKESQNFQYILTLNRDKIENEERKKMLDLEIEEHRVANFTKQDRFLYGPKYSEM